jgi:circadian clock protein KaiB
MADPRARGKSKKAGRPRKASKPAKWDLRLYIAGRTPRAEKALENLERICAEYMAGSFRLVVIDILKKPLVARGDQIIAVPTLVRNLPTPIRRIIGDLSDTERVLVGLDIRSR